jgi:acyl-CoA hydrolase
VERDVVQAVRQKVIIMESAGEFELSVAQAEAAFGEEIKRHTGVAEEVLRIWLSKVDEVLRSQSISPQECEALLQEAVSLGIKTDLAQRILEHEQTRRGVQIETKALYCPLPECGCSFAYRDFKYCPKSGKPLVEPSIHLWVGKFVRPALESDLLATLDKKADLLARARDLELIEAEAEEAFANEVKQLTGVTDDDLKDWMDTAVQPALGQEVLTNEDRSRIIADAVQRGMARDVAGRIIDQVLPLLTISTPKIDFGAVKVGAKRTRQITVTNAGSGRLRGKVKTSSDWITASPATLDPGTFKQTIEVRVDTSSLQAGEYSGKLIFETSGGVESILVRVTVRRSLTWLLLVAIVVILGVIIARVLFPPKPPLPPPLEITLKAEPSTVPRGEPVRLYVLVHHAGAGSLTYSWTTTGGRIEGSGPEVSLNTSDITVTDHNVLIYVSVTVTDNQRTTKTDRQTITVIPPRITTVIPPRITGQPTASIQATPARAPVGTPITLTATVSGLDSTTAQYQWTATAGDIRGSGSTVTLDTSQVNVAGSSLQVTIGVVIRDSQGRTANAQAPVEIYKVQDDISLPPLPTVQLTYSPATPKAGEMVTLTATATGESLRINWWTSIGQPEGSGFIRQLRIPPSHRGPIQVRVTVTDRHGRSAAAQETIPVSRRENQGPTIERISADKTRLTLGESTRLTVQASDPDDDLLNYTWIASAGSVSPLDNGQSAMFSTSGIQMVSRSITVTVTVIVKDGRGGSTSANQLIEVINPEAPVPEDIRVYMQGQDLMTSFQRRSAPASNTGSIQLEVQIINGTPRVTQASGALPGVPCSIPLIQADNGRNPSIIEAPGPWNGWSRIRVRVRPDNIQHPIRLTIRWRTLLSSGR